MPPAPQLGPPLMFRRFLDRLGSWVEWFLVLVPGRWLAALALVVSVVAAMPLLVLPRWGRVCDPGAGRDWYGLLLGVFGLWYTVSQLYQTKRAAEAAHATARESARNAYLLRVGWARDAVGEADRMLDEKRWKAAALRLRLVAPELRWMQAAGPRVGDRWNEAARLIDRWADYVSDKPEGRAIKGFNRKRWRAETADLQEALEAELRPTPG